MANGHLFNDSLIAVEKIDFYATFSLDFPLLSQFGYIFTPKTDPTVPKMHPHYFFEVRTHSESFIFNFLFYFFLFSIHDSRKKNQNNVRRVFLCTYVLCVCMCVCMTNLLNKKFTGAAICM